MREIPVLRRHILLAAGGVAALVAAGAMLGRLAPHSAEATTGWDPQITDFDRVMGRADAPVTIIEYSSFTCGYCASFHTDTLPELKQRFIDTGMARLVFRDFPLDGLALRAGMLARCAEDEQYFSFIDALFASQRQWLMEADPVAALGRIARMVGMSPAAVEACLADEALADRLLALRLEAQDRYGIDSTPTFVINGEVIPGLLPIETFAELIQGYTEAAAD